MSEVLKSAGRRLIRLYCRLPVRGKSRLRNLTDRRLAPAGMIETVTVGPCVVQLDHRYQATRNMAYGTYERDDLAFFKRVLGPGDVAVDVGANVGFISANLVQCVGPSGRVYSFEPGPTPFQFLQGVQQSNQFQNMEVFPFAVAADEREAIFYETESIIDQGYGRLDNRPTDRFHDIREFEVHVTSLTGFFADKPCDRLRLVKIDVEGHEQLVIEGMRGLLDRGPRPVLVTEATMHGTFLERLHQYGAILAEYGYEMYAIGRSLSSCRPEDLPESFHANVAWIDPKRHADVI